jgi:hypothetical protein
VVGGNRLSPAKAFTLVAILTAILVEWVVATTGKGAYFELARPDFAGWHFYPGSRRKIH